MVKVVLQGIVGQVIWCWWSICVQRLFVTLKVQVDDVVLIYIYGGSVRALSILMKNVNVPNRHTEIADQHKASSSPSYIHSYITLISIYYSHESPPTPLFPLPSRHTSALTLSPTTPECCTQRRIMVRQFEHILRQTASLNNTPHLHCAILLNQRSHRPQ